MFAMDRDAFYTVTEVSKILDISKTRVRQLIHSGEIEAEQVGNVWQVVKHSVHSFRDSYEPKGKQKETPALTIEARDALDEVKELTHKLGRLEGRLELEAVARSTLEAQLQREQERADQERLERIQAHEETKELRVTLEAENQRLREELQAEQSKGFWQRIFSRE